MADDTQQQDRTEQATPKRLEDARKKGDVPRSRELTMTCVMIAGASGLLLMSGSMGSNVVEGMSASLSIERQLIFDVAGHGGVVIAALVQIAYAVYKSVVLGCLSRINSAICQRANLIQRKDTLTAFCHDLQKPFMGWGDQTFVNVRQFFL